MAIQMARFMQGEVFTTAGTEEKCALCRTLGAKRTICYRKEDFKEVISRETGGEGVHLVLDMVGGEYFQKNLSVLAPRGILISIAFLEDKQANVNFAPLLMKNLTIMGTTLRSRSVLEKHELARSLEVVFWPALEQKALRPVVDSVWTFAEADGAHEKMVANQTAGKLILRVVD
jgi:NADPH:quinone reductase-like Zn-dependent oxidoreductase